MEPKILYFQFLWRIISGSASFRQKQCDSWPQIRTFMKIDGMPAQKCEDVTKELIKLQGMKDAKVTKTQEVQYEGGGGSRGESVHRG